MQFDILLVLINGTFKPYYNVLTFFGLSNILNLVNTGAYNKSLNKNLKNLRSTKTYINVQI